MLLPLGNSDWELRSEGISRIQLLNMYLVENRQSPDGLTRVTRPSLLSSVVIGDGPISGIWQQDGVLEGVWLVVSDETLFSYDGETATELDDLPGDGLCEFAGATDRALILRDGVVYSTDGATVTTVTMPDSALVGSIESINGFFLLSVLDSDRFYWIIPGGTDPDALDFATAERSSDPIRSINVIFDEIWLLGTKGPEVWTTTTDADSPFQRINGRVYSDGCLSRDTVVTTVKDNLPALFWITPIGTAVMAQGQIEKISDGYIEAALKTATDPRAWGFRSTKNDFVVLTAEEFTFVYDVAAKTWLHWTSYPHKNWRAHLGIQIGSDVYAADKDTGDIWILAENGYDGDPSTPILRKVTGGLTITGAPEGCHTVIARCNVGRADDYTDELVLEMRYSDDAGFTWSDYIRQSMGGKGEYFQEIRFDSLGRMTRPGRLFDFRFSQPAKFRIDYVTVNER